MLRLRFMVRFDNQPQLSEEPPWEPRLTPRVYWAMVRDLLNEALSFAIALRAAPYEAVDRSGRDVLLDAASQLVDAASCVLDAVESSTTALELEGDNVRLHPCMLRMRAIAAESRVRLDGRRSEIDAATRDIPLWRLVDSVADARSETVRALEAIAECYGAPQQTRRRFRTYWDEHSHYSALACRSSRRLLRTLMELQSVRPMATRLRRFESQLDRHVESFEFALLRQSNRWRLHALLERIQADGARPADELAQRRLWQDAIALVRRVADDQSARAS